MQKMKILRQSSSSSSLGYYCFLVLLVLSLLLSFQDNVVTAQKQQQLVVEEEEQNNSVTKKSMIIKKSDLQFQSRIVGGVNTVYGEFPFMVGWYYRFSSFPSCGGSLIAPNLVLTAAHCGEIDGNVGIGCSTAFGPCMGGSSSVKNKLQHPYYTNGGAYYDYMILELNSSVDTNIVPPIELNFDTTVPRETNTMLTVIGFGTTFEGGNTSVRLKKVNVPTTSLTTCRRQYGNGIDPNIHLCAGYRQGGKDSCQGDSGGPLFTTNEDGSFVQMGVVSFGAGCARPNSSGVYARVSGVKDWLQDVICTKSSATILPSYCPTTTPVSSPTPAPTTRGPTPYPTSTPTVNPTPIPTTLNPTPAPTPNPTTPAPTTSNPTSSSPTTSNPTSAAPIIVTDASPVVSSPVVHPAFSPAIGPSSSAEDSSPVIGPSEEEEDSSPVIVVDDDDDNPTTNAPVVANTNNPTSLPTTVDPTTASPTTDHPTSSSPISSPPTRKPTTVSPTVDPTVSPTRTPTALPTVQPSTASPTTSNPTTALPTTASPTTCMECTNIPIAWMKSKELKCMNSPYLFTKCNVNANWSKHKYCQLSCYIAGRGYPNDNCCITNTMEVEDDEKITTEMEDDEHENENENEENHIDDDINDEEEEEEDNDNIEDEEDNIDIDDEEDDDNDNIEDEDEEGNNNSIDDNIDINDEDCNVQCTDIANPYMDSMGWNCRDSTDYLRRKCIHNGTWKKHKYCQYSCYQLQLGYDTTNNDEKCCSSRTTTTTMTKSSTTTSTWWE